MSTVSMTSTPDTNPLPQPAPTEVRLDLADLQTLLQSVDLAARRGAFGAGEMSQVGLTFNRVAEFLQAAIPAQPPVEAPAVPSAPTAADIAPPVGAPLMPPLVTPAVSSIPPFAPKGA